MTSVASNFTAQTSSVAVMTSGVARAPPPTVSCIPEASHPNPSAIPSIVFRKILGNQETRRAPQTLIPPAVKPSPSNHQSKVEASHRSATTVECLTDSSRDCARNTKRVVPCPSATSGVNRKAPKLPSFNSR
ncbi:hypothetical protein B0T14DRAFT_40142 [Immersiella caudata]|uniref:Uncharacterized protein n=1 Tax=Immersiella caudata TaxID=314043 RepID=A0AA39XEW3_9PEZI|nr:hypothetical protein B0T14DRAFT_40142 [Immersiella caudata]